MLTLRRRKNSTAGNVATVGLMQPKLETRISRSPLVSNFMQKISHILILSYSTLNQIFSYLLLPEIF